METTPSLSKSSKPRQQRRGASRKPRRPSAPRVAEPQVTDSRQNGHNSGHVNGSEAPLDSDEQSEAPWPEPKRLGSLAPGEPFEPEMLPSPLRARVQDVQELMQVPMDYVAVSAIILLAAATNRRARVQPKAIDDSWQETLNLWGAIIAPPGDKKTSVMARMLKPLRNVEVRWRQEDQQALSDYSEAVKQAKKDQTELPPKVPMPMRCLIVNDATPEALHAALRENPAGLTSIHDELTGWLGNLQKAGREGERGLYLACWNGDTPHQLKRIGRGTVDVPAACLSMLGGIQPKRLASYLAGENGGVPLSDDGLLQRIQLAVWPDRHTSYRYIDRLPDKRAESQVDRIVEMLTGLDPAARLLMKFAPDAQQIFVDWLVRLETRLATEDLNPLLAQYLGKYRSLMPILSALFELTDWAVEIAPNSPLPISVGFVGCRAVSRSNAERAIRWCHYLESHARRICSLTDSEQHVAIALAIRLHGGEFKDGFTPRMVVQKNWRGLHSTPGVNRACRELVLAGWIRGVTKPPDSEGGRPSISYQVNPRIKNFQLDDMIWAQ
jgi:hypothetical protein